MDRIDPQEWARCEGRYRGGEWRDRIIHDLILEDARRLGPSPTTVDIGCGRGFDGSVPLQRSIAQAAGRYIGIEPDPDVPLADVFTEVHRCTFEDAPLADGSVQLAFAIMVLEHLPDPQPFWDKLHRVLAPGGVFWGLTIDARHPFRRMSLWMERLRIKDRYLDLIAGDRGRQRYENYPVYYRTNTPEEVEHLTRAFQSCECRNLARVGQYSAYLPRPLRPLAHLHDRLDLRRGRPGTLLVIRARR